MVFSMCVKNPYLAVAFTLTVELCLSSVSARKTSLVRLKKVLIIGDRQRDEREREATMTGRQNKREIAFVGGRRTLLLSLCHELVRNSSSLELEKCLNELLIKSSRVREDGR